MYERNLILEERKTRSRWYICACAFTSIRYCIIVSRCSPPPWNINYQMMKPRLWSGRLRLKEEVGGACMQESVLCDGVNSHFECCFGGGRGGWWGIALTVFSSSKENYLWDEAINVWKENFLNFSCPCDAEKGDFPVSARPFSVSVT